MSALKIIVLSPGAPFATDGEPMLAVAAARAGACGVIDLTLASWPDFHQAFARLCKHAMSGQVGLRCRSGNLPALEALRGELVSNGLADAERLIIFSAGLGSFDPETLQQEIAAAASAGFATAVEAINLTEARLAQSCGATAVVAKGHEGAGRVGDITTFVLVQQFIRELTVPVWAQGGIGLHSAAAVLAAGGAGIVLDSQLYLCRDSGIDPEIRLRIERMDGSETTLLTGPRGQNFRLVGTGLTWADAQSLETGTTGDAGLPISSTSLPISSASLPAGGDILPVGQDACFARLLAQAGGTVSGAIEAIRYSSAEQLETAARAATLAEGSPLARSHGTRYPIVQGAMTRVSDTADFALKVAEGGALPFLALSLMRGSDIEKLLAETREKLGALPWGVGLLGFVPQALRQEQLAVVDKFKPPFAMIAGGRPDQAKAMEEAGTPTYLHVPSPLLLKSFIEMGSRRFIFEGKECGGHVGPRSSFILWQSMVEVLLDSIGTRDDVSGYHIIFAGGIHDSVSAAMVAALAAPLSARGIKCGFLVGTAYLFTEEAVATGAIVERFQQAALSCGETVLLETGPGHSIRCIDSPYKNTFAAHRDKLEKEEKSPGDIREELELLNLGRLRIASKGLTKGGPDQLLPVPAEQQWQEGMYMIGQVASMHETVTTISALHQDMCAGGQSLLAARSLQQTLAAADPEKPGEPIAIVGMSCQFPQSNDVETYWRNILEKVDTISEIPATHFDWKNYYDPDLMARDKIVSKWGGFLSNIVFDPGAYGIPPNSLDSIDPMQVLILEAAKNALLDAGYGKRKFTRAKTSVILANAGHGPITALYSLRSMLGWKLHELGVDELIKSELPEWTEDSFAGYLGNVAAGRVANRLDLKGINFSIDAACASSLAALYVGMADLRSGASDVILLGATDTHNQPGDYLSFSKTYALSPAGRCKTFDAKADGIVISEGIAMLVLKRLSDAERDGDRIYAVIRGIGGSSDGRDLSLTAPRPAGQMLALERAYADAGISPASVQLVEAHGTGTVAGDRAEVEALTKVFQAKGAGIESCAIGSVKTNIGHSKAAAGLASLVKIAKALHHKVLPPTINVSEPNPACNFGQGPFYINSQCRPWISGQTSTPRRGSVSAFGFGGTNFHTVLEEYVAPCKQPAPPAIEAWPAELFVWKAGSTEELNKVLTQMETSVKKLAADYALESENNSQSRRRLFDLASKLHLKNSDGRLTTTTLAIIASSLEDLEKKIGEAKAIIASGAGASSSLPKGIHYFTGGTQPPVRPKLAFLFPGQGSQKVGMLQELGLFFPDLQQTIDGAEQILAAESGLANLSKYIYPPPAFTQEGAAQQQAALTATNIAQPAIGACDLAMLDLLSRFGIKADMTAGHSYGEYVALYAGGVFNRSQLLHLSAERGRILAGCAAQNPGAMAAVSTSPGAIKQLIESLPGVSLANINSPSQVIISGDVQAIESAVAALQGQNIACKRISVSAAFHSPLMNDSRAQLAEVLQTISFASPVVPVYSNTTARPYAADSSTIAAQLSEHALRPVLFADQVEAMHEDGARIFLEVGPGNVLTGLTDTILKGRQFMALNLDRSGKQSLEHFLGVLGALAVSGVAIDLGALFWPRLLSCRERLETPMASSGKKLLYQVNSVKIERIGIGAGTAALPSKQRVAAGQGQKQNLQPSQPAGQPAAMVPATASPTMAESAPTAAPQKPSASGSAALATSTFSKSSSSGTGASTPGNGNGKQAVSTPSHKNPNGQQVMASNNKPAGRPLPGRPDRDVDRVMLEFQQTMLDMTNRFLETQQNVMMAYLQAKQGIVPQLPVQDANQFAGLQAQSLNQAQTLAGYMQAAQSGMTAPPQPFGQPHYLTNSSEIAVEPSLQSGGTAAAWSENSPANHSNISSTASTYSGASSNGNTGDAEAIAAGLSATAAGLSATATGAEVVTADSLIESLYEIVSERTGYPREMLNPELDLEADMGIDSIKRVEILNNFRKLLPESTQAQLESGIEKLAGTKTLQGIIDWICSLDDLSGAPAPAAPAQAALSAGSQIAEGNGSGGNGLHTAGGINSISIAQESTAGPGRGNGHGNGNDHGNGNGNSDGNGNGNGNGNGAGAANSGFRHAGLSNIGRASAPVASLSATGRVEGNINNVARGIVVLEDLPSPGITFKSLASATLIVSEDHALAQMVAAGIEARGGKAVMLQASQIFASEENLSAAISKIRAMQGSIGSVINLSQMPAVEVEAPPSWSHLTGTFLLAKAVQHDLMANAGAGHRAGFINVTYMGGDFGRSLLDGQKPLAWLAEQAGIIGLTKTIAKEMPGVYVKVVDMAEAVPAEAVAKAVVAELVADDDVVEVGMHNGKRIGIQVADASFNKMPKVGAALLDQSSVVLVTGGARGITARVIAELARQYQPTFVIAGRLPKPKDSEAASTAGLTTAKEIKARVIEERKEKGLTISVREVERAYQQLMREREVRANLNELRALGATVKYYSVDVTDPVAFGQLISNIYETSTIDGIIHGAGVIEDALLKDKTVESFHRVFNTKVQSAITLAKNVRFDDLKFMFFFSSVVGRTGNSGQADYVSANEAVNKLALVLQQRTAGRVASLMWGPWQAGMAPPELEEVFASHGWSMIQPEDGRDCFHEEILRDCHNQVEVLLVGRLHNQEGEKPVKAEGLPVAHAPNSGDLQSPAAHVGALHASVVNPVPAGVFLNQAALLSHDTGDLTEAVSYSLTIDTKQHVYLNDHKFDGIPVMPMAVALEMMLEAAQTLFPEDQVWQVCDLDIPAGVVFQAAQKDFAIDMQLDPLAEKTVAVQFTSTNPKKVHFRCKVVFAAAVPEAPALLTTTLDSAIETAFDSALLPAPSDDLPQPQDVYGKWLFHGPLFQGISSVLSMSEAEITGTVAGCAPGTCVTTAGASQWLIDPVLFDSSMQLAGIWTRHFQDVTVLPTGFKSLRVFGKIGLGKATARVFLGEASAINLLCDLVIYDENGRLAVLIEGLGGIASKAFNRFSSSQPVPEIAR